MQTTLEQLNEIFKDVLDNETIVLTTSTTANDIEEWDSLNHIQLIVAIEKHFKLRFNASEINSWKCVGDMCNTLETKK